MKDKGVFSVISSERCVKCIISLLKEPPPLDSDKVFCFGKESQIFIVKLVSVEPSFSVKQTVIKSYTVVNREILNRLTVIKGLDIKGIINLFVL